MKKLIAVPCVAAIVAVVCASNPSSAAAPALSGKMTQVQYLVGTWSCVTKVSAMGDMAAQTHKGTMSFEIEPTNTVGYDLSSPLYAAAGFMGYQDAKNLWWSSSADNFGGVTLESGADGTSNVNIMTGTTMRGGQSMPSRDTITKTSNKNYEDLYEVRKDGTWSVMADSVCAKTSDTPD